MALGPRGGLANVQTQAAVKNIAMGGQRVVHEWLRQCGKKSRDA